MELAPFLTNLTPAGLLGLGVVMLMFGWIVPARMVRTLLASKDAVILELRAHNETQERALSAALRGNTATEAVLTATAEIQHRSGVDDGSPTG